MDHAAAMAVLAGWEGRRVLVVAFLAPGFSLRPMEGALRIGHDDRGVLRAELAGDDGEPTRIAFPLALFHAAGWVPGYVGRGLSVEQGATRVDVFLED